MKTWFKLLCFSVLTLAFSASFLALAYGLGQPTTHPGLQASAVGGLFLGALVVGLLAAAGHYAELTYQALRALRAERRTAQVLFEQEYVYPTDGSKGYDWSQSLPSSDTTRCLSCGQHHERVTEVFCSTQCEQLFGAPRERVMCFDEVR